MEFTEKYNEILNSLKELEVKKKKANVDMRLAYEYKEDLITKFSYADNQIQLKQIALHNLLMDVQNEIATLKIEFDLYVCAVSSN